MTAQYLGSLVGVARLFVDERDHGDVTYSIGVSTSGAKQSTRGVLSGNDLAIFAARLRGSARLTLPCGENINIEVQSANAARGLFTVDGLVPGF